MSKIDSAKKVISLQMDVPQVRCPKQLAAFNKSAETAAGAPSP
jgi:hypothetical protein